MIKFRSQLREKNIMNDFKYFRGMNLEAQRKVLKNLEDINKYSMIEKPYRLSILESDIPVAFKSYALKKINIFITSLNRFPLALITNLMQLHLT